MSADWKIRGSLSRQSAFIGVHQRPITFYWVMRFAILLASCAMAQTPPIADEALRMTTLRAIFPGMQISLVPGKRIDDSSPQNTSAYELGFVDALAKENVYRVVGHAMNEAEQCAAEDLQIAGKFSDSRVLRFLIYHWPQSSDLLAVLQYNFEGSNPAGSCWSVGFVARLWSVKDRYSLNAHHHSMLLSVRLLDVSGSGVPTLIVEPDFGGAGTYGSTIEILNLNHPKFEEALNVVSQISWEMDEIYTQVLDVPRTIRLGGTRFCFTKTMMFEKGQPLMPPRITAPCYKRGEGVDVRESEERNKMLTSLPKP
jgi:hypothetical protein